MPLLVPMVIAFLLSSVLMAVATTLSKKTYIDREKSSPFESGFDPKNNSRLPFSLRFFLIAIIFLIFDVEISLLLPVSLIFKLQPPLPLLVTSMVFLIIVTLGLFYEWKEGTLDWLE